MATAATQSPPAPGKRYPRRAAPRPPVSGPDSSSFPDSHASPTLARRNPTCTAPGCPSCRPPENPPPPPRIQCGRPPQTTPPARVSVCRAAASLSNSPAGTPPPAPTASSPPPQCPLDGTAPRPEPRPASPAVPHQAGTTTHSPAASWRRLTTPTTSPPPRQSPARGELLPPAQSSAPAASQPVARPPPALPPPASATPMRATSEPPAYAVVLS